MFTVENFINGIGIIFPNIQCSIDSDTLTLIRKYRLDTGEATDSIGVIPLSDIQNTANEMPEHAMFVDSMFYTKCRIEVPVKAHENTRIYSNRSIENISVTEHDYEFLITNASIHYIFALACFSAEHPDIKLTLPPVRIMRNDIISTLDDFVALLRVLTVSITAPVECSLAEYKKMLQSYLFNIAYNHNYVFTFLDLSEGKEPLRRGMRRVGSGQLFPYKHYNAELVKYYYQGISADIPFTKYLAFYHVSEFFFQTIAEQDAFHEIESFITRPSFSPYKKDDVRQFYNRIKKRMRDQRDDGVWDERTGLLLCLKKFVPDLDILKASVDSIDITAIEYYKNNCVVFSDEGKTINFDNNVDEIYVAVRNRVYSVRNAIVHSKEGERLRYEPFEHDKDLVKEIPLIRAIAEEIIINSSKPLDVRMR